MKTRGVILLFVLYGLLGCNNASKGNQDTAEERSAINRNNIAMKNINSDSIPVMPVQHASFVMQLNGETIYVDPIGAPSAYGDFPDPDFVLITHDPPDHL